MTAASVAAFAQRGITARETVFGKTCEYAGFKFTATPSTERDAKTLRAGGFTMETDRIVRVAMAALPVAIRPETAFTISGKAYRIKDVKISEASAEWIVGLVNPTG
jgi:hypothetical protein